MDNVSVSLRFSNATQFCFPKSRPFDFYLVHLASASLFVFVLSIDIDVL